jgi:hypothetical protein
MGFSLLRIALCSLTPFLILFDRLLCVLGGSSLSCSFGLFRIARCFLCVLTGHFLACHVRGLGSRGWKVYQLEEDRYRLRILYVSVSRVLLVDREDDLKNRCLRPLPRHQIAHLHCANGPKIFRVQPQAEISCDLARDMSRARTSHKSDHSS